MSSQSIINRDQVSIFSRIILLLNLALYILVPFSLSHSLDLLRPNEIIKKITGGHKQSLNELHYRNVTKTIAGEDDGEEEETAELVGLSRGACSTVVSQIENQLTMHW